MEKNQGFILIYGFYSVLYCALVISFNLDFINYYIITVLIATLLMLLTIIYKLEVKIDNYFFKFRHEIDNNIYNFIQKIWDDKVNNKKCNLVKNCQYLINNNCCYWQNKSQDKKNQIHMRSFYNVIDNEANFSQFNKFINQGFVLYYFCIIIMFSSVFSLILLNWTLLVRTLNEFILSDLLIHIYISISQILFIIFIFVYKSRKKTFFLLFLIFSLFDIILLLLEKAITSYNILIYLVFVIGLFILAYFGKESDRIKKTIKINQTEELIKISKLENEKNIISQYLQERICLNKEILKYLQNSDLL